MAIVAWAYDTDLNACPFQRNGRRPPRTRIPIHFAPNVTLVFVLVAGLRALRACADGGA